MEVGGRQVGAEPAAGLAADRVGEGDDDDDDNNGRLSSQPGVAAWRLLEEGGRGAHVARGEHCYPLSSSTATPTRH